MRSISKFILAICLSLLPAFAFAAKADCARNIVTVRDSKIVGESAALKLEGLLTSLEKATEKLTLLQTGVTAIIATKTKDDRKAVAELKKISGVTVSCLTYSETI